MSGPAPANRPLTVLVADSQPFRGSGMRMFLEGEEMKRLAPTVPVKVVGVAKTGEEALGLASGLSTDVALVDPAIGEKAGDGCSVAWLVLALRLVGVERVVLFGGKEELPFATMEEARKYLGADEAIEARQSAADLANAIAGTKPHPA